MARDLVEGVVQNEGCGLHCWRQGSGPLITFVPGGNGHGQQFFPLMAALSDRFTCVTFDRRQMSLSGVANPQKLSPPQQARDIRAVIQALGFDKSIIFGSSSGAIFAYQFAHDFPQMVDRLVAHEAPLIMLLPDASEIFEWFLHLMKVHETQGLVQVAAEFSSRLLGYDDEGIPPVAPPDPDNRRNFWSNEFPILLGYTPNLWRVRQNKTSVGVMRGVRCREAFFARSATEQAKVLDCPILVVPGHHQGFENETEEFLPHFLAMLDTLEKKKVEERAPTSA